MTATWRSPCAWQPRSSPAKAAAQARRDAIRRAAPQTDGNVSAIEAFERTVIAAVQAGMQR